MAFDEDYAQIFRDSLSRLNGVSERKMFGGLCFMLNDHMLCGLAKDGGMARVGKDREAEALELDGIDPCSFTGRPLGGIVELSEEAIEDDAVREAVLALAISFVESLRPKKPRKKK